MPGPHDFAVRKLRRRQRFLEAAHGHKMPALQSPIPRLTLPRPPHPAPNVRDDRETPLRGDGTESEYSCVYPVVKRNFGNSEIDGLV
jgi:hypothetical protein